MDPDIDFGALFKDFDTLLIGRRSYEAAVSGGEGMGMLKGMRVIVCSKTLDPAAHPNIEIIGLDLASMLRKLKGEAGKDIWLFGGGELFRSLLEEELVDQIEIGLIPVLLGGGIPLLPKSDKRARLELVSHRVYPKTGTLMLRYNVTRG